MLEKLLKSFSKKDDTAIELYQRIVAQARRPEFYRDLGVEDSVDGRFDMIVLHAVTLFYCLKDDPETAQLSQRIFNEMFRDMDRSLREMGVGDLGVPKKIRTMGEAFYGRLNAYVEGIDKDNLPSALQRNLFPGDAAASDSCRVIAHYMQDSIGLISAQSDDELRSGVIKFADIGEICAVGVGTQG